MTKPIDTHRILALWCHPRSMSTAIERLMRARGDLSCLHEPFMYDYYLSQGKRDMPYFEPHADHAKNYTGVRNMIMQRAINSPVFFKDMSYYVINKLHTDVAFSKLITHSFLIRHPRASIASYYELDNEVSLEEIGYEAQWRHYSYLVSLGIRPAVIEAESIGYEPVATVRKWWQSINLNFIDNAFEWESSYPSDWDAVKNWHSTVIESNKIRRRHRDEDQAEQFRFDKACESAPHLKTYFDHHLPFYTKLLSQT